ncbi:peptidase M19 [Caulobacter sp. Root655]|uniref:dipeptidase n=1 Tax=Caulobacter sp. Root655 TaxID=1736578 RepID=UPI0006F592D3|nr:dipeptidase [Caulobacter sp. Root655]KRA60261.1 peptidase M19 [Caulobacter sp. Root655]
MTRFTTRSLLLAAAVSALAFAATSQAAETAASARKIHEGLLTLDTHLDTPANFGRPGWDILDRHDALKDGSQIDYPRMVEGGLDGGFFAIYTPQGPRTPEATRAARDGALIRGVEIREMVAKHGDKFGLALKADDAATIAAQGKRVVYMSIENSYPIDGDVSLLSAFYALGVRISGLAHFKNNDIADSSTDKPEWHGLSPLGKQFVAEANRLGVVLDGSHSSDDVLDQLIALSRTPVILTHSGCKAVFDHPRNIDDARLKALADSGGVIQVDAYSSYLIETPKNADREAAMGALMAKAGARSKMSEDQRAAFMAEYKAIEAKWPVPKATFADFMNHLNHALKVAGVDHVGIGIDFDGGGGVTGLNDASDYWKISQALLAEGYTKADLEKIWSGNVLRLLRAAEAAKAPAG